MSIAAAISSWQQTLTRVGALCLSLSEEQLLVEVAPGKTRVLYLWGYLTAIRDEIFSVSRLGERGVIIGEVEHHPRVNPSTL
jgi:hypothetical protein